MNRNISETLKGLKEDKNKLIQNKQEYEKEIEKLQSKISSFKFKTKINYNLKGVIIHEGDVNYGHYFSFIKINEQWFKFDDLRVDEIELEEVMNRSLGNGNKKTENCYCLIYTKEDGQVDKEQRIKLLNKDVNDYILYENQIFQDNLESNMADHIFQDYMVNYREYQSYLQRNSHYSSFTMRIESIEMFLKDMNNFGKI